jgi:hypothetical protein
MKYPWLDEPMTLEHIVLHCVEDAGGTLLHFQGQILREKNVFLSSSKISGALQRAKRKGLCKNQGSYWSIAG